MNVFFPARFNSNASLCILYYFLAQKKNTECYTFIVVKCMSIYFVCKQYEKKTERIWLMFDSFIDKWMRNEYNMGIKSASLNVCFSLSFIVVALLLLLIKLNFSFVKVDDLKCFLYKPAHRKEERRRIFWRNVSKYFNKSPFIEQIGSGVDIQ